MSKQVIVLFSLLVWSVSCKKGPGEGGTSLIKGKVYILDYNGSGQLQAEYYAPEERVYIIYGDADFYGADTRTNFDGTFEFNYLRKGHYTVYAYSDCDTCASTTEPILVPVEITENGATIILPDIIVKR